MNKRQLRLLEPYLEGERPRENGEWDLHCPLHEDAKRSASINVHTDLWYCQAGCGGGTIASLIKERENWLPPPAHARYSNGGYSSNKKPKETITEGHIGGWHSSLMSDQGRLQWLRERRGLLPTTLRLFKIGWDKDRRVYSIPVYDADGEILNVRRYDPQPGKRRKIWQVEGMQSLSLYPIQQLDEPGEIIICEGEWDALLGIQAGYNCITRTGTADGWLGEWGELFADRVVYLAHDADTKGQRADRKIAWALHRVADVRIVDLGYPRSDKDGKDLTDYLLEHETGDLRKVLDAAEPYAKKDKKEVETITVLDSFDARNSGDPKRLIVTIRGRNDPSYVIPHKVNLSCTRDMGNKCANCPLMAAGGDTQFVIEPDDPAILYFVEGTFATAESEISKAYGIPGGKCSKLRQEIEEHQSAEVLHARPALDVADGTQAGQYKPIRITSIGKHDTLANNTIAATGALYPHPRTHSAEFLAWDIETLETSVDHFKVDGQVQELLALFQPEEGQRPLEKLKEIADDLSGHVTFIRGRPEMHQLMDLTFHSVLSFNFGGQSVDRGWLESLIVGDTRTGKSEAARQLVQHYGAGEIIGGEAASFAGLVGGLQQISGRDWAVTWGLIPINDRRLVVIDELSGLKPEDIAKMSDVRASGIARLAKIQADRTFARTRLLWMGNPRDKDMSDYTYGVDAIKPLIGNSEDIARFDLAMALRLDDVLPEKINQPHTYTNTIYTADACHAMLLWAWTRQHDQIDWYRGAEDKVFQFANEMGREYVESPPLVQAANVRIKIARVAAALAARTCSTTDFETLVIEPRHVEDAVQFIRELYSMKAFGYRERSKEQIARRLKAEDYVDEITEYLEDRPELVEFLRTTGGKFRGPDLEETLNIERSQTKAITNHLWETKMILRDKNDWYIEPMLHKLLREVEWT